MSKSLADDANALRIERPSTTLRGQVVQMLRTSILDARFRPGERLVERKLCEMLGVSRTLIREALRQLEAEGLVQTIPYKGPVVSQISPGELREVYEMRFALEALAAKLFAERAPDGMVARLGAAIEQIAGCCASEDPAVQRNNVDAFYDILLEGAGNDMLRSYVSTQRARLSQLRSISLSRSQRRLESVEEKREILRAIAARDAPAARSATETHITNAAQAAFYALTEFSAEEDVVSPGDL